MRHKFGHRHLFRCKRCGYLGGDRWFCPNCGYRSIEKKENKMIWFYYYQRDKQKRPVNSFALVFNGTDTNGDYARGTAECSPKDHPCKKIGRTIAEGRAFKALKNQCDYMDKGEIRWVSEFNPELTEYEKHIVKNYEKENKMKYDSIEAKKNTITFSKAELIEMMIERYQ